MATSEKPTILLIHGAWHVPDHYKRLRALLVEAGFQVCVPHLPTCNNIIPPPLTFLDDCTMIRNKTLELAEQGKHIIVLMHSYGGVVGTNSLEGLSLGHRSNQGASGGVIRLIYFCAFMLPLNACLSTPFGGKLPPIMEEQVEQGTCTMKRPEYHFYNEVEDAEERAYWISLLTLHPASAQKEEGTIRHAAYRDIPTTYLVCEQDKGLTPEGQWGMIRAAEGEIIKHGEAEGAMETGGVFGGKVDIVTSQGGHSPFLSRPEEIVACVERVYTMWLESR